MIKAITALLTFCLLNAGLSGCTVYKSSDRDDFNSNGKARAPIQAKPAALSLDDQDLLANPCAAFNSLRQQDCDSLFGGNRLSMTNQISLKTSTCLVEPSFASESSALSTVSILSCSWKPVDGQHLPLELVGPFAVQTTEDDLRHEGFSVFSSTVASGDSLRMNCEAYVSTQPLADDEQFNSEQSSVALRTKFNEFAALLKRETLSASGQR